MRGAKSSSRLGGPPSEAAGFLAGLVTRYDRVAITGGPGLGKTSVVTEVAAAAGPGGGEGGRLWVSTDRYGGLTWTEQREAVCEVGKAHPRWVLEGVTVARALRHGLPADAVLVLSGEPLREIPPRARALHSRVHKWVLEATPDLTRRGVPVFWWAVTARED